MKDWLAILGSIAAVLGGIRWLIRIYIVQQKKLEVARREAFESELKRLRYECEDLKREINTHRIQLNNIDGRISDVMVLFKENQMAAERVYDALKNHVGSTNRRLEDLEVSIENFGKVIFKK